MGAAAPAFFDGNGEAAIEAVFGREPELDQPPGSLAIASAIRQVGEMAPGATPLFVVVHDAGTPAQFMSVAATHPGRLIYAENYLFSPDGRFLRTDAFLDGEAGRQVVYSIYRLHFGWFGGVPTRLGYLVLGLAMAVVSVSGVNVWLARRKRETVLNDVWAGVVWGIPLALAVSAISQILLGIPSLPVLWGSVAASCLYACLRRDPERSRRELRLALGAACLALAAGHGLRFARMPSMACPCSSTCCSWPPGWSSSPPRPFGSLSAETRVFSVRAERSSRTEREEVMRILKIAGAWPVAILLSSASAGAVEPYTTHTFRLTAGETAPAATLADVAWFAGAWEGDCFDMRCEEVWNPPSAGTMVGLFKLYDDEGVRFYELMLLTAENGTLVLKVKHFNADFSAWEDKADYVSFPLVALETEAVHFRGLSFYRRGPDELDIWLALQRDDEVREHRLAYRRGIAAVAAE